MNVKLSMSIETLPPWPGSRPELREARICISSKDRGDDIRLISNPDLTFDHKNIAAMLRVFADRIEQKYAEHKEAA